LTRKKPLEKEGSLLAKKTEIVRCDKVGSGFKKIVVQTRRHIVKKKKKRHSSIPGRTISKLKERPIALGKESRV